MTLPLLKIQNLSKRYGDRVALSGVNLALRPGQLTVLLMDEPTLGLNPKSRRDLLQAIQTEVRERSSAVLWAAHLVEEAEGADRVVVLHTLVTQ